MNECRHEVDPDIEDCMNCEMDLDEFEKWWESESGWGPEKLSEYHLAKAAWFRAIQHVVDDMGLDPSL